MSSRLKVKAGGPEMGKLSMPTDKVGSGSRPAAIAEEREASTRDEPAPEARSRKVKKPRRHVRHRRYYDEEIVEYRHAPRYYHEAPYRVHRPYYGGYQPPYYRY